MFELRNGDPEKLEGRVLAYVENLHPHCENCKYLGIFVTSNPLDMLDFKSQEAHETAQEAWNALKKEFDNLEEKLGGKVIPMIAHGMKFASQEDADTAGKKLNADVLYAGKVMGQDMARDVLMSAHTIYLANYTTQLMQRMDTASVESTLQERYDSYQGADLKFKLYAMLGVLLDAVGRKQAKDLQRSIADLRTFAQGAPFFADVVNVVELAKTDRKDKIELMSLYIEKMGAIHCQNYESAAEIKKRIDAKRAETTAPAATNPPAQDLSTKEPPPPEEKGDSK